MENLGSIKQKVVAKALQQERANCNFDTEEFKDLLSQDVKLRGLHAKWTSEFEEMGIKVNDPHFYDMDRKQQIRHFSRIINETYRKDKYKYYADKSYNQYGNWYEIIVQGQMPVSLHFSMFRQAVDTLGTEEQKKKWLPLIDELRIIGTYC